MRALQLDGLMTEPLGPVALLVGLLALLAGAGGRVLDRPPWEPLRTWLDRAFRSGHDGTPGVDAGTRPARGDGTSGVRPPGADAPDSLLETARDRFSSGEYEGTAQAAYMHARLRLADAYDVGLGWTHRGFFEDCREGGLGEDLDVLDELTTVYERAVFSTEPVGGPTPGGPWSCRRS